LIRKKGCNENKGFGFIGVPNLEEANKINNSDIIIHGKSAETYIARSRMEAKNRIVSERYKKLFVGGLNMETESKDLKDFFKKFGSLNRAYVITDSITKTSRGFGFLEFNDLESTKKVLTIKSFKLDGNMIQVKPMMLRAELDHKPLHDPEENIDKSSLSQVKKELAKTPAPYAGTPLNAEEEIYYEFHHAPETYPYYGDYNEVASDYHAYRYPEDYYSYDYGYKNQNTRLPNSTSYIDSRKYTPYPDYHYEGHDSNYHQQGRYPGQYGPETSSYRQTYSSMGDMYQQDYPKSDYYTSLNQGYERSNHDSHYRNDPKYSSMNLNGDQNMNYQKNYGQAAYKQGPNYHQTPTGPEYYYEDAYASDYEPYVRQHEYYNYGNKGHLPESCKYSKNDNYRPTSTMRPPSYPLNDLKECHYWEMM
jgi:RNA recognition motif-containing protein